MVVEADTATKETADLPTEAGGASWLDRLLGPAPKLPGPQALGDDRRANIVLWTAALLLILLIFRAGFSAPEDLYSGWSSLNPSGLAAKLYWASWGYLFYFVLPIAVVLLVFRESPARFGLRFYLTKKTLVLYAGMILFMLPVLYWASSRSDFQETYPFVRDLGGHWVRTIIIFEIARVARFVCLEFFFRGYLLFGLEGKLGYGAVAASTLPYGIIHFGKPFPEAMAAIVAGAILGYLALRTRTIVGGAIVHSSVAVSMDLLSLWRRGFF